jgi:restriction endonuclease EcoRII-like protein/HNH endonuclease
VITTPTFVKVLTDNDLGVTGGHQVGVLIPKSEIAHFPPLDEDTLNPRVPTRLLWNGRVFKEGNFIHYNGKKFGKTRDEYRITPFTKRDFRDLGARTGDFLAFYHIAGTDFEIEIVPAGSDREADLGLPRGARPGTAAKPSHEAIDDFAQAETHIRDGNFEVPDAFGLSKTRRFQAVFRSLVQENFRGACCMPECPVDDQSFLDATHIVPWSSDRKVRLDPGNGLLLCKNHHVAFDSGLLGLERKGEDYFVKVSHKASTSKYVQRHISALGGKPIKRPAKYQLSGNCIAKHRANTFRP